MDCERPKATLMQFRTSVNGSSIEAGDYPSVRRGSAPVTRGSLVAVLGALGLILGAEAASAATATGNLPVQVTIVAECQVQSAPLLNFGDTVGLLDSAVDGSSSIGIQCTNNTGYVVRLDAGDGTGATIANRLMTGGGATVSYSLYRDAARTLVWGETDGTNTVAGTGDGAVQTINVYGRIPVQTTPAPGLYTDNVTVTVSY
jgi:spore coat protein U-like protein